LTIKQLLRDALESGLSRLDAEVLLAHVLNVERTYLYAWPERLQTMKDVDRFFALVACRAEGQPIAYLVGKKEFWSLDLTVSPAVLIPRPETELLVQQALHVLYQFSDHSDKRLLELGTGSGAISLAIALEYSECHVIATDISPAALAIAEQNAKKLGIANIDFQLGDWFGALSNRGMFRERFHVIVSNPPYIAEYDPCLFTTDLRFEPLLALRAGVDGLRDLKEIIQAASGYLLSNGWLVLEHGISQKAAVVALFEAYGFCKIATYQDLSGANRVTLGQRIM